jgi:hypothetical protein
MLLTIVFLCARVKGWARGGFAELKILYRVKYSIESQTLSCG